MLFKTLNVKPYAKQNRNLCDYNLDDKKKLLCYIRAKRIKSFSGGKAYRSLKLYRRSQTNVRYGRDHAYCETISDWTSYTREKNRFNARSNLAACRVRSVSYRVKIFVSDWLRFTTPFRGKPVWAEYQTRRDNVSCKQTLYDMKIILRFSVREHDLKLILPVPIGPSNRQPHISISNAVCRRFIILAKYRYFMARLESRILLEIVLVELRIYRTSYDC